MAKPGDSLVAHIPGRCTDVIFVSMNGAPRVLQRTSSTHWTVQGRGTTTLTFTGPTCQLVTNLSPNGCAGGVAVLANVTIVAGSA